MMVTIYLYAIYGNIYHQYTPHVSIYTIHGSYGSYITHELHAKSRSTNVAHPREIPKLEREPPSARQRPVVAKSDISAIEAMAQSK